MPIFLPEPHINQDKIIDCPKRFRVVMCGRRFGKSELAQIEIVKSAIIGEQVAYITPTYKLAKTFFEKLSQAVPYESNKSDLILYFPNNGMIEFFTGERLNNLRGRKFHLVVIDEASFIPDLEQGWLNSIRPTLTDYKGRALFLSTPRGKNYFYSLYMNGGEDWQAFKFSTYDNPYIDPAEIEDAKSQLPVPVFEQEYMANPMENAANPFGIEYIRNCIMPMPSDVPLYYGIDLAKSYDYTVIIGIGRNGNVCFFERFQKDWQQTKNEIMKLPKQAKIYIDSSGVGDPITEDLQRHFQAMEGYKYTAQSKQQLMELLAHSIQHKAITFPDGIIVDELSIFEYQFTSSGVRYNAPSGFHDDCVNALALAVRCKEKYKTSGQYYFI